MNKKLLLTGVAVCLAGMQLARGQSIWPSTLNATGGSTTISGIELEWSVGEMALVNTVTTSSIVVTQGLLQTRLGTGITEVSATTLGDYLQIFPNPTNTIVNVQFTSSADGTITTRLMDMAGRLLTEQATPVKPGANTQKLDVTHLAAATYMLQVYYKQADGKEQSTSYKIQKLQ